MRRNVITSQRPHHGTSSLSAHQVLRNTITLVTTSLRDALSSEREDLGTSSLCSALASESQHVGSSSCRNVLGSKHHHCGAASLRNIFNSIRPDFGPSSVPSIKPFETSSLSERHHFAQRLQLGTSTVQTHLHRNIETLGVSIPSETYHKRNLKTLQCPQLGASDFRNIITSRPPRFGS